MRLLSAFVVLVWTFLVAPASTGSGGLPLRTVATRSLPGGASRFDYESLDEHRHVLFIAHLGASSIVVFNTRTRRVVTTISGIVGVHGVLVVPRLHRLYATATDRNEVAVINEDTLRVVAHVPTGTYPDGIAYDQREQTIVVSNETGATDTVISTRTNQRIATIPLGGEAGNTQYDALSHRVLVDVQTLNQLVAIDPATNRVVGRYGLPGCDHDHGLLLDTHAGLAFVACDGNAVLLVIDLRSMHVLQRASVGADPDVLALDTGLHRLYVAAESGIVTVFDEPGHRVRKIGRGFLASEAHVVAVESHSHEVYVPLESVGGKPVLWIMKPTKAIRACARCGTHRFATFW